jgi:TRAP-type C4-dicarboxylate transport system permease small subunit
MQNTISNTRSSPEPSRIVRLGQQAYQWIAKGSRSLSFISEAALAFMMFLTAADVIMRYIVSKPITGAYELTEFAMAVFIGTGIAYTGILKGHVDVDVLVTKLPPRTQAILASIIGLLSTALFTLMTWHTFRFMGNIMILKTTSAALLIPLAPFIALVGVGCGILAVVIFAQFIQSVYKAIKL